MTKRRPDLAWLLVAAVAAADALLCLSSLRSTPWQIRWKWEGVVAAGCLLLLLLRFVYGRLRPDPRLASLANAALLFVAFTNLAAAFSYFLTAAVQAPLLDAQLAAADRALGFDWPACYRWFQAEPLRWALTGWIYNSEGPQVVLLILLLGTGQPRRAREFFLAFAVTGLAVIVLGALLPAAGAYVYYDVPEAHSRAYVQQYLDLRRGVRLFDLHAAQGIVQFPSFHAALAVLCCHAVRGMPRLFAPLLLLDLLVVVVTPAAGGHHFIDVAAGLGLAAAVIAVLPRLMGRPAMNGHATP